MPNNVRLPNGERGNVSRTSKPPVKAVSDNEVRTLLERYRCPVPFHAVRTLFLGNIASRILSASPLDTVKAMWGGGLPEFDSLDAFNELLAVLVMGLWNRLSRHQERNTPSPIGPRRDPGVQGRPRPYSAHPSSGAGRVRRGAVRNRAKPRTSRESPSRPRRTL